MPTGRSEPEREALGTIRRTILLVVAGALVLAACDGGPDAGVERPDHGPAAPESASPSASPGRPSLTASERRRVAIAAAVFDAIYRDEMGDRPEDRYEQVFLNARICKVTREFPGGDMELVPVDAAEGEVCHASFTSDEQVALLTALPGLPNAAFTLEPGEVGERILEGDLAGNGVLLSMGPIEGSGARVEVLALEYCGGLCARWMSYVLKRGDDGWEVVRSVLEAMS